MKRTIQIVVAAILSVTQSGAWAATVYNDTREVAGVMMTPVQQLV